jgi:hypothetical protein
MLKKLPVKMKISNAAKLNSVEPLVTAKYSNQEAQVSSDSWRMQQRNDARKMLGTTHHAAYGCAAKTYDVWDTQTFLTIEVANFNLNWW